MRKLLASFLAIVVVFCIASNVVVSQSDDPFGSGDGPFAGDGERDDPFGDAQPRPAFGRSAARSIVKPPAAAPPKQTRIWASPGEEANEPIRSKLAGPLTTAGFDFAETPLEEVVEFLQAEYGMPIQIDVLSLQNLGLESDQPITCTVKSITLDAALRLALSQLELTCYPVDGYLLITSQEEAETRLIVAVYPVGDLVTPVGFDALIDVIVSTVSANAWCEVGGGEADIRPMASGMLVVSQTRAVHDQIAALLEAMRRVPANALIDPKDLPEPPPTQIIGGGGGWGGGGGAFGWGGGFGGGAVDVTGGVNVSGRSIKTVPPMPTPERSPAKQDEPRR